MRGEKSGRSGDAGQLVESLRSTQEALGSIPRTIQTNGVGVFAISTFEWWRQEDEEFQIVLGYMLRLRPAWATGGSVPNKTKANDSQMS